ncbi:hypothetical protein SAMN05192568_11002 [Methylobacterium pseudosasicola]|uniref:Uncharacterized protein n=1 Tax=Methylobacterium pseudosasicola TaxID=582667 RepID=A0A1I4VGM5_9HYPH|nr:hypothetical protein SAMN05192568_11002 [Methylobacterium pseudosasicola]
MSSLKKIERDQRSAELSSVNGLIDRLTDDDFITRIGLRPCENADPLGSRRRS